MPDLTPPRMCISSKPGRTRPAPWAVGAARLRRAASPGPGTPPGADPTPVRGAAILALRGAPRQRICGARPPPYNKRLYAIAVTIAYNLPFIRNGGPVEGPGVALRLT